MTALHGLDLLDESLDAADAAIAAAAGAPHHLPTPCREWDLGVLVRHLADSARALHELISGSPQGPPPLPGCSAAQAAIMELGELAASASREDPQVALTALTGSYELVVHAWDISEALSSSCPVSPTLASELLSLAPVVLAHGQRQGLFAPALEPGAGQSDLERLVGIFGRSSGWRAG